jgi:peptidoglycan/LPS O-acetylase OafA/YrhL
MTSNVTSSGFGTAPVSTVGAHDTARTAPVWRVGVLACIAAAVATTVLAAIASGAGVPLEIDDEPIPLLGFTQLTLFFSAIGLLLALALRRWAAKPKRAFLAVTLALVAVSIVPDVLISATPATKLTLFTAHLVAASIVIPLVAARLPARTR